MAQNNVYDAQLVNALRYYAHSSTDTLAMIFSNTLQDAQNSSEAQGLVCMLAPFITKYGNVAVKDIVNCGARQ